MTLHVLSIEIIDNENELDFLDRRWTDVAPFLLNFNESLPNVLKPSVSQVIRNYYVNGLISSSTDLNIIKVKLIYKIMFPVLGIGNNKQKWKIDGPKSLHVSKVII